MSDRAFHLENGAFRRTLRRHGLELRRGRARILQLNLGKLCNQTCSHCHAGAGPGRGEVMPPEVADRIIDWMGRHRPETVDLTGGAPELCPEFRRLAVAARGVGARVTVRCNLTVIFEPGQEDLPKFYREHRLELICSLPCYLEENVDLQRGRGVYARSVEALERFNALGYGRRDDLRLTLVCNPVGAALPPDRAALEADYRAELRKRRGIEFHDLLCLTNLPVTRFRTWLEKAGRLESYNRLLFESFNPETVDRLMCRDTVNVGWEGDLFDCDFNQMVGMNMADKPRRCLWEIDPEGIEGERIATAGHCFGCTAGHGSGCGGTLA